MLKLEIKPIFAEAGLINLCFDSDSPKFNTNSFVRKYCRLTKRPLQHSRLYSTSSLVVPILEKKTE